MIWEEEEQGLGAMLIIYIMYFSVCMMEVRNCRVPLIWAQLIVLGEKLNFSFVGIKILKTDETSYYNFIYKHSGC